MHGTAKLNSDSDYLCEGTYRGFLSFMVKSSRVILLLRFHTETRNCGDFLLKKEHVAKNSFAPDRTFTPIRQDHAYIVSVRTNMNITLCCTDGRARKRRRLIAAALRRKFWVF